MTPNDIQVLAYYHAFPQEHPLVNEQWFKNSVNNLIQKNLIKSDTKDITSKGKVMMKMLCDTPLPKRDWVDPR